MYCPDLVGHQPPLRPISCKAPTVFQKCDASGHSVNEQAAGHAPCAIFNLQKSLQSANLDRLRPHSQQPIPHSLRISEKYFAPSRKEHVPPVFLCCNQHGPGTPQPDPKAAPSMAQGNVILTSAQSDGGTLRRSLPPLAANRSTPLPAILIVEIAAAVSTTWKGGAFSAASSARKRPRRRPRTSQLPTANRVTPHVTSDPPPSQLLSICIGEESLASLVCTRHHGIFLSSFRLSRLVSSTAFHQ